MKEKYLINNAELKKGNIKAWWENFSNINVPESDWKVDFCESRKSFYKLFMYEIAPIFAEEAEPSEKSKVSRNSSGEGATEES